MALGRLLVLTGFSGSGKDTVMGLLVAKYGWGRIVTHSAGRNPRRGEIPGQDHFFVGENEFRQMVDRGEFLEYTRYGETWKGTTKKEIEKVKSGEKAVWRIDPTAAARAEDIISQLPEADLVLKSLVKVFLTADEETIRQRALRRNPDGDTEVFRRRREVDMKIWQELVVEQKRFEHIVENREGEMEKTIQQILAIIQEG